MATRRHILAQGLLSLGLLASSGTALAQTPYDYPATAQVLREVFAVVARINYLEDPKEVVMGPVGYPCIDSVLFKPEVINATLKQSSAEQIQSDETLLSSAKIQDALLDFKRTAAPIFTERNAKKADRIGRSAFEQFGLTIGQEPIGHITQHIQNIKTVLDQPQLQTQFEQALFEPVCAPFVNYLQKQAKRAR